MSSVAVACIELRKKLCTIPVENISIIDEVAAPYCCLPRGLIHNTGVSSSLIQVKDRLTVDLTVYGDGRKAMVTVTGKSQKAQSFPRH